MRLNSFKMKKIYSFLLACIVSLAVSAGAPDKSATAPTVDGSKVVSLFCDEYTDVTVDTWRTSWSQGDLTDTMIGTDNVKKYSNLNFVGVETVGSNLVDASAMMYVHIDVWVSSATQFRLKLVDFGADEAFGGGDDTEHELVWDNPATNEWISYHIPFTDLTNLANRDNLAQYIFAALPAGSGEVYIDNFFFTTEASANPIAEPSAAAADPTEDEADVISLFSGVYTDVTVDTWRTSWSQATLEDVTVDGNDVKKYSELDFVGVETVGANSIDATEMEYIHFDFWTPNATTFRIKLVDFGADNAFGGGDDTEHEIAITDPAMETWVNQKIALSDFTGLAARAHISQIIFSGLPTGEGVVYLDNVYFSKEGSTGNVLNTRLNDLASFANPASQKMNIQLSPAGTSLIQTMEIRSITGQVVWESDINNRNAFAIDIAGWTPGIYLMSFQTEEGVLSRKILVQ
jgi:hypothetical protein